MEKDVQNLKDKTGKTNTKVNDLEKSVEFHDQDISDSQKDLKKVQHEADELKMQLLYQGHYSRRENLMFVGNEENGTPFDDVENTKEVTYDFLQRELNFDMRMPKVDSNFSGFTEWEKEQVRSPVLLS